MFTCKFRRTQLVMAEISIYGYLYQIWIDQALSLSVAHNNAGKALFIALSEKMLSFHRSLCRPANSHDSA